jgi:hypothetical protein
LTPDGGGQVAIGVQHDERPPRVVHGGVPDLGAGAVGVDDGVLEVLLARPAIARVGVVLLVAIPVRTILRYGWDNLASEQKVRMQAEIIHIAVMQEFEAEVLGARAVE